VAVRARLLIRQFATHKIADILAHCSPAQSFDEPREKRIVTNPVEVVNGCVAISARPDLGELFTSLTARLGKKGAPARRRALKYLPPRRGD
jgi:hypothetical protein